VPLPVPLPLPVPVPLPVHRGAEASENSSTFRPLRASAKPRARER
jgi:hypothetical protein